MKKLMQRRIPELTGVVACAAMFLATAWQGVAVAQDSSAAPTAAAPAADNAIVASLNPVPQGLACSDAAQQAQVSFDFQKPDFDIKQVSLYLDGHGVPQDSITQQWPRITLSRGLHEGRNTVEVVATGDNDHSVARQLTVLIGTPAQAGDENAAVVSCDASQAQVAQTPPPVAEQPEQQVVQVPAQTVVTSTVYVAQPVYVYHTVPAYPVWPAFIPFIPVIIGYPSFPNWYAPRPYCPPPVVSYYPAPPPRVAPPVMYRPPVYPPQPPSNIWRTPYPGARVPVPVNSVPMPLQSSSPRPGYGTVTYYSSQQPSGNPAWGSVTDMNTGGNGTRYRTPPPAPVQQQTMQPYGAPTVYSHGQPSGWNQQPQQYREPPHQNYVHENYVREPQPPRPESPHSMSPPRMNAAPAGHGFSHGGWH